MTTWRAISGFDGLYEVSDQGDVRSLDRIDRFGRTYRGRVLAQEAIKGGYLRVALALHGTVTRRSVHQLVLEAFVGPQPEGMEACHENGRPDDNRRENLRWDSHPANIADSVRQGANRNARKTHCPRGHALSAPNLTAYSIRVGRRSCLACARAHADAASRGIPLTQQLADEHYSRIGDAS